MINQHGIVPGTHKVVNVASVPHRSPFRYPGGKTWLVPHVRAWLASLRRRPTVFVEPFAGGGVVGLTVAAEGLAKGVILGELDDSVAAVWETILNGDASWLANRILAFEMTRTNVMQCLSSQPRSVRARAFQTILRNRVQRGGILAPGATLMRNGENGRGVASRWYPQTLARRILAIAEMADRVSFVHGDAFELMARYVKRSGAAFFVDPPYTVGGKRAGRRLYRHNTVDHRRIFQTMAAARGPVMLTYASTPEVRRLAAEHGFAAETVLMKNTHHVVMDELILLNRGATGYTGTTLPDVQLLLGIDWPT